MWPGRAAPQGQHAAVHLAPQPLIGVAPHPFLERPMCWAETLGGVREWDPPLPRGKKVTDPRARSAEGCPLQEPLSPHQEKDTSVW